jgi:hypothetical protein
MKCADTGSDRKSELCAAAEPDVLARGGFDFDANGGWRFRVKLAEYSSSKFRRTFCERSDNFNSLGRRDSQSQCRLFDHQAHAAKLSHAALPERKHAEVEATAGRDASFGN